MLAAPTLSKPKPDYYIFGDGASSQKQDIGAWCALIIRVSDMQNKVLTGTEFTTSISRMN